MLFLILVNFLIRSGSLDKGLRFFKAIDKHRIAKASASSIVFLVAFLSSYNANSSSELATISVKNRIDLPVPKGIKNQLFYLQRNPDANTVIYKLNIRNGRPDPQEPVKIFWIRYAEEGQIKELSALQRKLAYGIKSRIVENGRHELRFVSFPNLPLYLSKSKTSGKYQVSAKVGDRELILNKVFVKVQSRTLQLPKVDYIELSGEDADTGKKINQIINI